MTSLILNQSGQHVAATEQDVLDLKSAGKRFRRCGGFDIQLTAEEEAARDAEEAAWAADRAANQWADDRRYEYMRFPEHEFREAVYALLKALHAQGIATPVEAHAYVSHVDDVRARITKPA